MRRLRRRQGDHLLLEGPHLVGEAAAAGLPLEVVLATPEFLSTPAGDEVRRALAAASREPAPPLQEVAAELLEDLADVDSPRGVLAVGRLPRPGVEGLPVVDGGSYLYLDGLQDPGNLGALARVAEASGAVGMALGPGCAHPNHPRALRGSAGSLLRLPVAVGVEAEALAGRLEPIGARWAVLVPRGGEDLYRAQLGGTLVLAVGAEGPGVSAEVAGRADLRLTIPVEPPVESLNATVAAAVVLFEIHRRRRER